MCISKLDSNKCEMFHNRTKLGRTVRAVLTQAKVERRLICGLMPALGYMNHSFENVVLCVLPPSRPGDATSHMQTVLLQAFCYENCIPVIQVNDCEKLGMYCGLSNNRRQSCDCMCAIITRSEFDSTLEDQDEVLSKNELFLTEFYECTLGESPTPVIELPI